MATNRRSGNRPFDRHFCFFIQDFKPGDCLLVNVDREKVRGYVESVDTVDNTLVWSDADGTKRKATLNDIALLQDHESDWL